MKYRPRYIAPEQIINELGFVSSKNRGFEKVRGNKRLHCFSQYGVINIHEDVDYEKGGVHETDGSSKWVIDYIGRAKRLDINRAPWYRKLYDRFLS